MHIPPNEYLDQHYLADYEVFGSNAMCGMTLFDSLQGHKRPRFRGLTEFVVCQFELNLLNQAIYTHAGSVYSAWRGFSAPFADTHGCSMGHGMGNQIPYSILRFAQQPFAEPGVPPVSLTWKILVTYTKFFLEDYVARFIHTDSSAGFSRDDFLQAVGLDHDCAVCVLSPLGWETKHVMELVKT